MDPRSPDKIYGKCIDSEIAAKGMCWVETTLRSPEVVPAGETIRFSIEVKWWFQIQEVINLGEESTATFDLTEIKYGQSNYDLKITKLSVNGTPVTQSGIDIRRWNQTNFASKFYPFPAAGLDDPVELVFKNITEDAHDLELLVGGPAVLQIG